MAPDGEFCVVDTSKQKAVTEMVRLLMEGPLKEKVVFAVRRVMVFLPDTNPAVVADVVCGVYLVAASRMLYDILEGRLNLELVGKQCGEGKKTNGNGG
jgi:hypothetical protein